MKKTEVNNSEEENLQSSFSSLWREIDQIILWTRLNDIHGSRDSVARDTVLAVEAACDPQEQNPGDG